MSRNTEISMTAAESTITIVETAESFYELREEWDALLKESSSDCVFLTHEWLYTWWKHLADGRRLFVLAARMDGKLVAIMPLARRSPQYARMMPSAFEFLGSGVVGSDYLDLIARRGYEGIVVPLFARFLHRTGV